jgi:hypothetical protein
MSVTLSEILPESTHLSGNPIWVKATSSGIPFGATHYKMLLKIISINDVLFGSPFVDAHELNANNFAQNANNFAYFDISGYVDQPLPVTFSYPMIGVVSGYADRIHVVHLQAGEYYIDSDGNMQKSWFDVLGPLFILSGKIDDHELTGYNDKNSNWFAQWVEAGKFLSRLPDEQKVHPNQPVKLWIKWPLQSLITATFTINAYYSDGYVELYTFNPDLFGDHIFEVNLQPALLGIPLVIGNGSILIKYNFYWSGGSIVSPLKTFVLDWNPKDFCNYLFFLNPTGGIDCIWLSGSCEPGHSTTFSQAKSQPPKGAKQKDHSMQVSKNNRMSWQIDTGYKSRQEMEALYDLFGSEKVWLLYDAEILDNAKLYPVIVENSDDILTEWDADIHSLSLKLIIAH